MLRPRSVLRIGKVAEGEFTSHANIGGEMKSRVRPDYLADFLFEHEFSDAVRRFLWAARPEYGGITRHVVAAWDQWVTHALGGEDSSAASRDQFFVRFAEVILQRASLHRDQKLGIMTSTRDVAELVNTLRLDGYEWADGSLRRIEENVFDVVEQTGALQALWERLGIGKADQLRHNLKLADEHYEAGRWGDCITHARHVVEVTFRQIAEQRATSFGFPALSPQKNGKPPMPVVVRDHLRTTGFYDQQEQDLLNAVYGLVSREGGHPNIAPHEIARILRQHAFTVAHFLLLRFESLHPSAPPAAPTT